MNKENLAINNYKDVIIDTIRNNQVVVIEAPTGSGKTTQLPQIIFNSELTWGKIGVTQPRRIATYGVAKRIAFEMNEELGNLVGYKMRFDDHTNENTKIKIMTDGILLEELRSDSNLLKYSVIMVDEAHERSLNIDFILGILKEVIKTRKDLRIIISSATINAKLFSCYYNNAPIISIQTKPYPIEVNYLPLSKRGDFQQIIDKIVSIIDKLEEQNKSGDILVFLEGEASIKNCCQRLQMLSVNKYNNRFAILPLYARLAPEEQNRVFDEFPNKRKIVVSTNIAETSLTIDGIVYVIDPGYAKMNFYNPRTFTSFLETKPISKSSCDQRKGRAGRTAPGIVFRLYSQQNYEKRDLYTREEIYRTDLSEVVLRMADLGIKDYLSFDFISSPNRGAINSAMETLRSLDALDDKNQLTEMGKRMVDFPLGPRLSRVLFEAIFYYPSVTENILIIISFLSTKSPYLYPLGFELESRKSQKKLAVQGGDFFSWVNTLTKYIKSNDKDKFCEEYFLDTRAMNELINILSQLKEMMVERDYPVNNVLDYDKISASLCSGLRQYICCKEKKGKNSYGSMTERNIRIHPASFLYGSEPKWIIGGEIVNTGRTYIRSAISISENIIKEIYPNIFNSMSGKVTRKVRSVQTRKKIPTFENIKKIYILDKYFDVTRDKKGYYAIIPYSIIIQLQNKKNQIIKLKIESIRAKLFFKEKVIVQDKLTSLVRYFDKIDLSDGINNNWPKDETLLYPDDWYEIYRYIKFLMKPTVNKPKAKKSGFLTLRFSKKNKCYYYSIEYDFFFALENCIGSLEKMFDSEINAWTEEEHSALEKVYRNMILLSESLDDIF